MQKISHPTRDHGHLWRKIMYAAIAVYCFFALALMATRPGIQYDEALHVLGTVHMRHSSEVITLPHDPNTWVCPGNRCLPLMTLRYTGALKEYLCLPLFSLFRPSTMLVRLTAMFLGALGLLGFGMFLAAHLGPAVSAAVTLALAVNPTYVNMTVFDNAAIAGWMAAFGLSSLALSRYLTVPSAYNAFLLGLSAGFATWVRANFLWLLAAALVAAFLIARRDLIGRPTNWAAAAGGFALGAAPFLAYQIVSGGGTWQALGMFDSKETLTQRLYVRLVLFSESLLSDREHRAMWGGMEMPAWQRWTMLVSVVVSVPVSLFYAERCGMRGRLTRAFAVTFVILAAVLFLSKLEVSEHHLVILLPLAAAVVVLSFLWLMKRFPPAKFIAVGFAVVYGLAAIQWQAFAIQGLARTGGVGVWSDAMYPLAGRLMQSYPNREITILDWGLQNNLYVITDAKLKTREALWDLPADPAAQSELWLEAIRRGGVFLLHGPEYRQFPVPSRTFLESLESSGVSFDKIDIRQKNGSVYAEIIEIGTQAAGARMTPTVAVPREIHVKDPQNFARLEGFHQVEERGWRWTKREFSMNLIAAEADVKRGATLRLNVYIPDVVIQKLGSLTISARVGEHSLSPELFQKAGESVYRRDVSPESLKAGDNRFLFTLDKALPPTATDQRELGIIVSSASLNSR